MYDTNLMVSIVSEIHDHILVFATSRSIKLTPLQRVEGPATTSFYQKPKAEFLAGGWNMTDGTFNVTHLYTFLSPVVMF